MTATVIRPTTRMSQPVQAYIGPSAWANAVSSAAVRTDSLLKNPASGGIPTSAASPSVIVTNVTRIAERSPPISLIRFVPTL